MAADVHVFGASYATAAPIRSAIEGATGRSVVMRGIVGATLDKWAREIPAPGSLEGADVLVLELGGNGVPTPEQVREADRKLRATGARVRWVTLADWPDDRFRQARTAARLAVTAGASSAYQVPGPARASLATDRAHLTPSGYAELGRAMVAALGSTSSANVAVKALALVAVLVMAALWGRA